MTTATFIDENTAVVEMIEEYLENLQWKRDLEKEARQAEKVVNRIGKALLALMDENQSELMEIGGHHLIIAHEPGRPSYKSICEKNISPAILAHDLANTPPKRKLYVD